MAINTPRDEYVNRIDDWISLRAAVEGEAALRRDITRFLPVPPGLNVTHDILESGKRYNDTRYAFYSRMAEFPEIVSPTLSGILGLVHEKRPTISLPSRLQYLEKRATPDGETLIELWERATKEILITGRFVLLGDIYEDTPYLCEYPTESLINWRVGRKSEGGEPSMIVLQETHYEPKADDEYTLESVELYRKLYLEEDGTYTVELYRRDSEGAYVAQPIGELGEDFIQPQLYGRGLDFIPLTVVNALDVGFEYGPIPLLPMTRRALGIFRRSADYNRSLYIKGDPQCVIFGIPTSDVPTNIGGSSIWAFENPDGKAQYLDIDGQGIPLMRQAINDEFDRFADEVGMLLEGSATGYESGEALRRRQSLRQVTIKSVVINAGEGVRRALQTIGRMLGLSEAEIESIQFTPNIDFTEPMMTGQELMNLINAKRLGAPISDRTIHNLMSRRQLTELGYEEERAALVAEPPLEAMAAPTQPSSKVDR